MPASAVIQQNFRNNLARLYANVLSAHRDLAFFKIGEGGHTGGVPNTPSDALLDIEAEGTELTGTATFTNGSASVTGTGTLFTSEVAVGDYIRPGLVIPAGADPGSAGDLSGVTAEGWYEVAAVNSDTSITLASPYNEADAAGYRVMKLPAATGPLYVFRKNLGPGDVNLLSTNPAVFEVRSVVDGTEANTRPWGGGPTFYEVGFFNTSGVMVAYMTFDGLPKVSGKSLYNIIEITV